MPEWIEQLIASKIAKWLTTSVTVYLIQKGYTNQAGAAQVCTYVLGLVTFAWHCFDEWQHNQAKKTLATPIPPTSGTLSSNISSAVKVLAVASISSLCASLTCSAATSSNQTQQLSAGTVSNLNVLVATFEASGFFGQTISGALTNVIEETGYSTTLHKPKENGEACIAESYPLIHITYKAIDEHICFVHSDTVTKPVTDQIGVGFNTAKRVTPSAVNVSVGSVAPVAHHGLFVNVVVNTVKAVEGRFGSVNTTVQGGGYVTF